MNFTDPLRITVYLQIYQKNHQNIYKTAQNIGMCDEQRYSRLLEPWYPPNHFYNRAAKRNWRIMAGN